MLDMPYNEVDRIAKMIPGYAGDDHRSRQWRMWWRSATPMTNDPAIRNLVDTAKKLEGMVRNSGVHASAVVIAPVPLDELVPLLQDEERRNRNRLRHEGG